MPKKKYVVTEVFSQSEINKMGSKAQDVYYANLDSNVTYKEKATRNSEYSAFAEIGIDPLDTVFVGPFTANEYLTGIGTFVFQRPQAGERIPLMDWLVQTQGAFKLEKKDLGNGQFVFDFSDATKEEMKKMKTANVDDLLTAWDKFMGFFGYKTDHARSVELSLAGIEAIKAKKYELNKMLLKEKRNAFINSNFIEKQVTNNEVLEAVTKTTKDWRKIFFGDETKENKVPDYVLDNGKKVSPLSLCMAALQQHLRDDLSATSPEEFAARMAKDKDLKEYVRIIGDVMRDFSVKSNLKKLQYVDELMNGTSKYAGLDDKLKMMLKKNKRPLDITTAAAYKGMGPEEKAENVGMLAQSGVMFMMKEDMLKVYDNKNDPIYSMKDENGNPKNPAAAEMEHHVKATLKAAVLYKAIQMDNYDKLLEQAGFGDDYTKLDKAFEYAEKVVNEASKGVTEIVKEENETQIEEIDLEDDFAI